MLIQSIRCNRAARQPRKLEIELETVPLAKPAGELLRFHAWWHGDDYTGVDQQRFTAGDRRPDWPLLVNVALWAATIVVIVYAAEGVSMPLGP